MIEPPRFKNYVAWYGEEDSPKNRDPFIRDWLLNQLPYEIIVDAGLNAGLRDIGENTLGLWSAYRESIPSPAFSHYFFAEEVDVMAFKLKFL